MSTQQIPWGLKGAVPKDATIAWGARTILRDGYVDILGDRQGFIGPTKRAIKDFSLVVQEVLPTVKKRVHELYARHDIDPGFSEQHVLFDSEELRIVGNTNASHGYLYLAAWKK